MRSQGFYQQFSLVSVPYQPPYRIKSFIDLDSDSKNNFLDNLFQQYGYEQHKSIIFQFYSHIMNIPLLWEAVKQYQRDSDIYLTSVAEIIAAGIELTDQEQFEYNRSRTLPDKIKNTLSILNAFYASVLLNQLNHLAKTAEEDDNKVNSQVYYRCQNAYALELEHCCKGQYTRQEFVSKKSLRVAFIKTVFSRFFSVDMDSVPTLKSLVHEYIVPLVDTNKISYLDICMNDAVIRKIVIKHIASLISSPNDLGEILRCQSNRNIYSLVKLDSDAKQFLSSTEYVSIHQLIQCCMLFQLKLLIIQYNKFDPYLFNAGVIKLLPPVSTFSNLDQNFFNNVIAELSQCWKKVDKPICWSRIPYARTFMKLAQTLVFLEGKERHFIDLLMPMLRKSEGNDPYITSYQIDFGLIDVDRWLITHDGYLLDIKEICDNIKKNGICNNPWTNMPLTFKERMAIADSNAWKNRFEQSYKDFIRSQNNHSGMSLYLFSLIYDLCEDYVSDNGLTREIKIDSPEYINIQKNYYNFLEKFNTVSSSDQQVLMWTYQGYMTIKEFLQVLLSGEQCASGLAECWVRLLIEHEKDIQFENLILDQWANAARRQPYAGCREVRNHLIPELCSHIFSHNWSTSYGGTRVYRNGKIALSAFFNHEQTNVVPKSVAMICRECLLPYMQHNLSAVLTLKQIKRKATIALSQIHDRRSPETSKFYLALSGGDIASALKCLDAHENSNNQQKDFNYGS